MSINLTVAIMAGGKSSRMGQDKAFVLLEGKPMIQHVIERVAEIGQAETILITNRPAEYAHLGLTMFGDIYPDKGSLGGIYTGIYHSQQPYTLVVACDMPFLNPDLLRFMGSFLAGGHYDVVVPRFAGYPETLHAIYSRACLAPIQECLLADRLKITGFYETVRVKYLEESDYQHVDAEGRSFQNINTPDELKNIQKASTYDNH